MQSWKEMIEDELGAHQESFADVVSTTLTSEELLEKFNSGWGATHGKPFTVWTKQRVYFPVVYDGSEWVGSVARYPDGIPTEHVGGG